MNRICTTPANNFEKVISPFFMPFVQHETDLQHSYPKANIKTFEDRFEISLALPGISKEEVKLSLEKNHLFVSVSKPKSESNFKRKEFDFSNASRSFLLPSNVDTAKITAKMNDGILTLDIFKKEEELPKPINIL